MEKVDYDLVIIGGGPAGLTAGIYAARDRLNVLLVEKMAPGGQVLVTDWVDNYPGFPEGISGFDLCSKLTDQAKRFDLPIESNEVISLDMEGAVKEITLSDRTITTHAIILTPGASPRRLDVPGEDKFYGKGVSFCGTCDAPFYKDKVVAAVGGGDTAVQEAVYLTRFVKKVYLIHRRDEFRGFEYLAEKVKHLPKVEILYSHVVTEIKGDKKVNSIVVQDLKTNKKEKYFTDGVFVEIGSEVKTDLIKNSVKLDKNNQVVVNQNCETFYPNSDKIHPGIFAAGDVTDTPFKQIVTAAGDGAKAALQAWNYLHGMKTTFVADWGKKNNK